MNMEEDFEVPLVLGRPFMKTVKIIIDMNNEKLKVKVQDDEVNFNVFEAPKDPTKKNEYFRMDMLDKVYMDSRRKFSIVDPLGKAMMNMAQGNDVEEEEEIRDML